MSLMYRFLVDKYNSSLDVSHIGFLCPQTIAASTIRDDHQATTAYLKDFFLFSRDRGDAGCKLILAPYYEEYIMDFKLMIYFYV